MGRLVTRVTTDVDVLNDLFSSGLVNILGDVLVQVIFHAQLAAERGDFDLDDVAREINEKLVRRHPHVFGPGPE